MIRTIHCTVVETPAVSDPYLPPRDGFSDLVPWADPYIAALVERLRRTAAIEEALASQHAGEDDDEPWSPREWPQW
jgi:hypothetical protein